MECAYYHLDFQLGEIYLLGLAALPIGGGLAEVVG
jgi:hypothetical protein